MSDLHEDLSTAFAAVDPGAAPVEAAMLDRQKIKNRRRAGLLAGAVAVVVAAVVGVPAFTHQRRCRARHRPRPGHGEPAWAAFAGRLIASGLIGGAPWNVTVTASSSNNCVFDGNGFDCVVHRRSGQPGAADPISFDFEGSDGGPVPVYITFGEVWKDVVSARVELSDGTILTLHPVEVDGLRFVAFASPSGLRSTAYRVLAQRGDRRRHPLHWPDGVLPSFEAWLRPGQARRSADRAFGSDFKEAVAATAYIGPWGTCIRRPRRRLLGLARPATGWMGGSDSVVGIGRGFCVLPGDHAQRRQHPAGGGDRGRPA